MRFIAERLRGLRIIAALALVFTGLVTSVQTPAQANNTESATIGMSFDGKWAYNVTAAPPWDDVNDSHPAAHDVPSFGSSGGWGSWNNLGSAGVNMDWVPAAVVQPNNGNVHVFTVDTSGKLWERVLTPGSGWSTNDLGYGGSGF